ncbi:MAG: MFS transporter [Candidatus Altiarchaeota archaeon]|nr:MFS transporter [Candidatus Altiarchaeota archaeon]
MKIRSAAGALEGVSGNVILLGLVSLLTDMSSEMINPILPMFLAGLGASGFVIGVIGGLGSSVSSIVSVFAGYWSDRNGRRVPFVFAGYGLSAATKLLFAFATQSWHILVLKPVERIGKGLRNAPRDSIIAESKKEVRGRAFGIHRTMDSLGALIGSVLAFLIIYLYLRESNADAVYRNIFIVAGFLGFLALVPLMKVKDVGRPLQRRGLVLSIRDLPGDFKFFTLVATVFALANFTDLLFILRSLEVLSGQGLEPVWVVGIPILLYVWYNVFNTIFSTPVGMLSDRIGRRTVLVLGWSGFAATSFGFAFFPGLLYLAFFFAFYGISIAFIDGTQRALASDLAPPESRATALGTFHTLTAFATLPGSAIAGFLWDAVSPQAAFVYGAVVSLLAVILFSAYKIIK